MPLEVFISYSHKDKTLRNGLAIHLSNLKNQGIISDWYDGDIVPGTEWEKQIFEHLNAAQIILLLISANFLASPFCYGKEMKQAIERHEHDQARVIPIILRPCDWREAPFGKLQALPTDGMPITDWRSRDKAFLDIAVGIRKAIATLSIPQQTGEPQAASLKASSFASQINPMDVQHMMDTANEEFISILKQGTSLWNEWRDKFPELELDLRYANLRDIILNDIDLSKVNLSNADLSRADLRRADLSAANLSEANLSEINLRKADLREAILRRAVLIKADLREANLRETKLNDANISEAILSGADLRDADLQEIVARKTDLRGAKSSKAILNHADLSDATLNQADLSGADLHEAMLSRANLSGVNLSGADLSKASLRGANLSNANLYGANLSNADLTSAILIGTNLEKANLSGCLIYEITLHHVNLNGAEQTDLIITLYDDPIIVVDNLEFAQLISLLLSSSVIRDIINTITTKVVLLLGRFSPDRKVVLDVIKVQPH